MYRIMHKNQIIALADNERLTDILQPELCPGGFAIGMPLSLWLDSRSIDIHRSHSRQLFKALHMRNNATLEDMISTGHGISITDNWWIQRESESLDYRSLKDYNETLANISFYGFSPTSGSVDGYKQLGTTGSFEKTWRYIDGNWLMYKQGDPNSIVSEYYAYHVLRALNVPVADYQIHHYTSSIGITTPCILTRDFTEDAKYDLDPFCNYFRDNEEPSSILPKLLQMDKSIAIAYAQMKYYDALLINVDRHNENVAFLRDSESGQIIRLAPLYDFNLCLSGASASLEFYAEKGSGLMPYFLKEDACVELILEQLPSRRSLVDAVHAASAHLRAFLPEIQADYTVLERYILAAYDFSICSMEKQGYLPPSAQYHKATQDFIQKAD